MKYKTLGAIKAVQNIPYCKADEDMYVGMGVILDRAAKTASLPAGDVQTTVHIVTNIDDKPPIAPVDFSNTLIVKKGEYVRADDLRSVIGLEMELSASEVADDLATLAAGDELIFGADGKIVKGASAGYAIYFKVIELTTYLESGVLVEICAGK